MLAFHPRSCFAPASRAKPSAPEHMQRRYATLCNVFSIPSPRVALAHTPLRPHAHTLLIHPRNAPARNKATESATNPTRIRSGAVAVRISPQTPHTFFDETNPN